MKIYCDLTGEDACIGLIPGPGQELVLTGTRIHTEPEEYRTMELAVRLAEECDVHFWFGADGPAAPFYTVPQTEVFAHDSRGGYFVAREQPALDWSKPLYYMDAQLVCHRLSPAGESLADLGPRWRENMVPSEEIRVFRDWAGAQRCYPIRTLQQLLEEEP